MTLINNGVNPVYDCLESFVFLTVFLKINNTDANKPISVLFPSFEMATLSCKQTK